MQGNRCSLNHMSSAGRYIQIGLLRATPSAWIPHHGDKSCYITVYAGNCSCIPFVIIYTLSGRHIQLFYGYVRPTTITMQYIIYVYHSIHHVSLIYKQCNIRMWLYPQSMLTIRNTERRTAKKKIKAAIKLTLVLHCKAI